MRVIFKCLDFLIYWSIVLIPFFAAIAPAPMNVFMGFLIIGFMLKKILGRERISLKPSIIVPLLSLFIITCLSVFNTVDYRDSFKGGIMRLLQYVFILLAVNEGLKDKQHARRAVFFIFLGLSLTLLDELFQVSTGKDFIRGYPPVFNLDLVRATASFKDSNTLGIYLSALAPIVFGLALFYYRGVKKAAAVIFSILILAGAALTYSRPTLLALYIALLAFSLARRNKRLTAILLIFVFISPFLLPKSIKEWARSVEYNPIRFMCNDDRIAVYRNSVNMIKAHPFVGVGAGAYMKSYKYYKEFPEYRNIITLDEMKAHNNFFHMAAEIGLIGFGVFIWLLYALFGEGVRIYRQSEDSCFKIISLCVSVCLVSFLVNGLTESSLYYSRVAVLFWYLAGFSLALGKFTYGAGAKKDTGSA